MTAPAPTGTGPDLSGRRPAFGALSPALSARAERGYARFLATTLAASPGTETAPAPESSLGRAPCD